MDSTLYRGGRALSEVSCVPLRSVATEGRLIDFNDVYWNNKGTEEVSTVTFFQCEKVVVLHTLTSRKSPLLLSNV